MKSNKKYWVATSLLILCVSFAGSAPSHAASGAITVTPGYAQVTAPEPNKSPTRTIITVHSSYASPVTLHISTVDLLQHGSTISPGTQLDSHVASALSFSPSILNLAPNQTAQVTVSVKNTDDLTPGGHYVALLLTEADQSKSIGVGYGLSVELFIQKQGGERYDLTLTDLQHTGSILVQPDHAITTFKNTGNVHVIPRALITITDPTGAVSAQGIMNQSSMPLLPGNVFTLTTQLHWAHTAWMPGVYKLTVQFGYDGSNGTTSYSQQFWYIPWTAIAMAIVLIGAIAAIGKEATSRSRHHHRWKRK